MISQRSKRNKAIFQACQKTALQHKILYLLPLTSTLLNTSIMYLFGHPWFDHEAQRLQTQHAPFFHYISFYIALLVFLYCRNLVNALFNGALTVGIQQSINNHPKPMRSALSTCLRRLRAILTWVTFMSCFAGFYKIYSSVIAHRHHRKAFGGSYFHYAGSMAQIGMLTNDGSPLQLLKYYGKRMTARWGAPPLRQGFSLIGPLALMAAACLIPGVIGLVAFQHYLLAIQIAMVCSAALLMLFFSAEKLIIHILHQVIYNYCIDATVHPNFTQHILDKAFVPFIIEE